jgi:D-sedoheptulose 7-phosphate isomerase
VNPIDQSFIALYLEESAGALQKLASDADARKIMVSFSDVIVGAVSGGHKVMLAGNGGSAADAQHIAAEFISRFLCDRAPLPAIALTTDSSVLTAIGNDYGYDKVFERQVLGLGHRGDVLLGISTSGQSPNILRSFEAARSRGIVTLGFTGAAFGSMDGLCDHILHAPSTRTPIIQQIHILAAHLIFGLVEQRMFGTASQSNAVR